MFFIVVYHCLTHGVGGGYTFGFSPTVSLANLAFSDLLLVASSTSVNLYVLVSGYFLCNLDFKPSRIVRTWASACFYSFLITVLIMLIGIAPFSMSGIGKSLFPVSTDAYWFVTQYIGLLILSPFLSILIRHLTYRQYIALLVGGAIICLSILPDFPLGKRFHVAHGNSVWFFAYLFLIAGFVRNHLKQINSTRLLVSAVIVSLVIMLGELYMGVKGDSIRLYWFDYNALPFILSVIVFVIFKQIRFPERGFWNTLAKWAPYTFGVYLIHDHLLIREWLWKGCSLSSQCDNVVYPLLIIGICTLLFLLCLSIDLIRKKLFDMCRIDEYIKKLDGRLLWP